MGLNAKTFVVYPNGPPIRIGEEKTSVVVTCWEEDVLLGGPTVTDDLNNGLGNFFVLTKSGPSYFEDVADPESETKRAGASNALTLTLGPGEFLYAWPRFSVDGAFRPSVICVLEQG